MMGLFRLFFYPQQYVSDYADDLLPYHFGTTPNDWITFSSQMPHIDMDLSLAQTYVMDLPYIANRPFMSINEDNDWFYGFFPVDAPRDIGGLTAPVLHINLYLSYHDVEMNGITQQGGEGDPAKLSGLLNYARRLAKRIPVPWLAPIDRVLKLGEDIASMIGWSRPPNEPSVAMICRNTMNPSLMSSQMDFSFVLASNTNVMRNTLTTTIPGSKEGDTNLRYIIDQQDLLVANWAAINWVGVVPGASISVFGGEARSLTRLAWVSSMFRHWTGSINLCLQVVCSPLVRWRIGVVIVPPGVVVPTVFPLSNAYLTQIIEIAGTTCFDIEVPYINLEPWRDFQFQNPISFSNADTRIAYFSLMAPTGPSPTTVFPHIQLWIKAGKSFSLGVPDLTYVQGFSATPPDTFLKEEEVSKPIVEQAGVGENSESVFGEIFDDLLYLTRRASLLYYGVSGTDNYLSFPIQPCIPSDDMPGNVNGMYWTFHTYCALPFLGETGSVCYKLALAPNNDLTAQYYTLTYSISEGLSTFSSVPPTPATINRIDNTSCGGVVMNSATNPIAEVRFVDRNKRNFRASNAIWDVTPVWCAITNSYNNNSLDGSFSLWESAGDDLRFGNFIYVPFLFPRAGPT